MNAIFDSLSLSSALSVSLDTLSACYTVSTYLEGEEREGGIENARIFAVHIYIRIYSSNKTVRDQKKFNQL